ncbi:unnamed protein product, partial [Owenia fusiformis]
FTDDMPLYLPSGHFNLSATYLQVGKSFLQRAYCSGGFTPQLQSKPLHVLHHTLDSLEAVMKCIEMNWMTILVSNTTHSSAVPRSDFVTRLGKKVCGYHFVPDTL